MKVVVTGMGVVAPVGIGVRAFWNALCRGDSGIREIRSFDAALFPFRRGGEIADFDCPAELRGTPDVRDGANGFMLAAAREALWDAGLSTAGGAEAGVVLATNFGGIVSGENLLAQLCGKGTARPSDCADFPFQACADYVANRWNLTGPRAVLSLSCAAGTAAIGYGADLIRAGRAAWVLTGGYDALSRFAWSGLSALKTMTRDEVRPFDRRRSGTLFGEGAGAVIVEEAEHARRRGARLYAEVSGFGANNNAYHMTAPAKGGAGSVEVLRMALDDAGMAPEAIDHINAHGTGTPYNDAAEAQAFQTVFGARGSRIPVTSIKSMTGHMLGAAGSAEAIASVLSICEGVIPPTTNYGEADPECDLNVVATRSLATAVGAVLSNSAGIGGCNAAVVFRKVDG